MRPLDETMNLGDTALPVDGLEVEEVSDESTIRQFLLVIAKHLQRRVLLRSQIGDSRDAPLDTLFLFD